MREILRHLKIWLMLVRLNFMSQMEYRANFVSGILMETGYLAAKLMYVLVAYEAGRRIAGFGPDEILVFVGTYVALTGFYAGVFAANLFQLSTLVRDGSFDTILVKPVNDQFLATFRRSDMGAFLLDFVAGLAMVAIGLVRLRAGDAAPGLAATGLASSSGFAAAGPGMRVLIVAGWGLFAASGAAVGYAIWVMPMTLVFRFVRADSLAHLADSFWDFNNVPMVVYGKVGQAIGVFVIPIFVITNFPALFALGRLPPLWLAWGLVSPVIFLSLTAWLWKRGLRHYASGGN